MDAADAATEEHARPRIEFPEQEEAEREQTRLEAERAKHKARAEKFGVEYVEPAQRRDLRLDARKERFSRPTMGTGFEPFTQEETAKRAQRAGRFGLPAGSGLAWKPPVVAEDEEKKRQRAARFGVEYQPKDETGLMDVDLFESRRDPSVAVPRRPEAVHIYGVDLMSTGDILKYFADYGPQFVEWINDSSANVLFADPGTAKRAVAGMGQALPPDEAPEQMGMDPSDPASLEFLWHKGADFVKAGSPIPLIFRIATVEDVKPADRVPSRRLWISAGRSGGGGGGGGGQQQRHQQQQEGTGGEQQQEYQQRGRGQRRFKVRGSGRPAGWQHDDRGGDGEGEGEGGDVDIAAAAQRDGTRRQRRQRNKRGRGGDAEMAEAGAGDYGGGGGGGGMEVLQDAGPRQRFRPEYDPDEPRGAAFPAADAAAGAASAPPREQVSYQDL